MVILIDPVHKRTSRAGLSVCFCRAAACREAGGVVVGDRAACGRRVTATHTVWRIEEIVISGESCSTRYVDCVEHSPVGQIDKGIVVNVPVVRVAVGGRRDDTIPLARAAVRISLMPHQHISVDIQIVCRTTAHRHDETCAFHVLEDVVADSRNPVWIN